MAYIAREDGVHFVIPSYRDVLSAKQKSRLKKDVLELSASYGEYITMQRKNASQYEIAFSPETGYLLGESIWHYFKRPADLIYCEAIPNTTEAILVIVKSGGVYLDGRFPIDSIPEELLVFLTETNQFEINIYGDVPISQTPTEGKFSFDASSVKSFTVLENPVFATLPLLKIYQLQLVEIVLKTQGIGVFPVRQVFMGLGVLVLGWILFSYLTQPKPVTIQEKQVPNPYQLFLSALATPAPDEELNHIANGLKLLFTMPGWTVASITYSSGTISAKVTSKGSKVENLVQWAKFNNATVDIKQDGILVTLNYVAQNRPAPTSIYPLKEVLVSFVDKLADVYPGNHLTMGAFTRQGLYTTVDLTLTVGLLTPLALNLISKQFKGLPMVLKSATFTVANDMMTGTIIFQALGN